MLLSHQKIIVDVRVARLPGAIPHAQLLPDSRLRKVLIQPAEVVAQRTCEAVHTSDSSSTGTPALRQGTVSDREHADSSALLAPVVLARERRCLTNAWLADVIDIEVPSCRLDRPGDKIL